MLFIPFTYSYVFHGIMFPQIAYLCYSVCKPHNPAIPLCTLTKGSCSKSQLQKFFTKANSHYLHSWKNQIKHELDRFKKKFLKKLWCCVSGRVWQGNLLIWAALKKVNWPPWRVKKLMFWGLALCQSNDEALTKGQCFRHQLLNSLRLPIYIINLFDNTRFTRKLLCLWHDHNDGCLLHGFDSCLDETKCLWTMQF